MTTTAPVSTTASVAADTGPWELRLEQLIDRAPSVADLRAHRLHLAAIRVWRARGLPIPPDLADAEHLAALMAITAPMLLRRARSAYDGRLMLMKGPEAAAHHPHPSDRVFRDLDLLVDDARAAQRAFIAAGFVQLDDPRSYEQSQHLAPLGWPGIPLSIEVHRRPNQPAWLRRPSVAEILERSVPSATGVDGVLAPAPELHALVLVAHSWINHPLGRLADLFDTVALLGSSDRGAADALARAWGWDGMWRLSVAAADAILGDRRPPASLGLWARHLWAAGDRTVLENHIASLAAPMCALPATRVPTALAGALRDTARRRADERWADKLRRSRLAVAHAFMPTSAHHERTHYRPRGLELAGDGEDQRSPTTLLVE